MDHGQILEQPYYTTVPATTATSTDNNLGLSAMDFSLQGFPPQPPQVQAQFQEAYSQIDFFYEQPQQQQQQQPPPTNTTFNINTTNTTNTSNGTVIDEDYVQNLTNELQHTKQLLKQYQLRTEQLMELVTKQTDKIKELREQLKNTTATL